MKLIFEKGHEGRRMTYLPDCDVPLSPLPEPMLRAAAPRLPEMTEAELDRHYTGLAKQAFGVSSGFYPLGSCTMKHNPRVSETIASLEGFAAIHPLQPEETAKGCLEALSVLEERLCRITGMDAVSMQPAAGAHGEFLGLLLIKKYHEERGDIRRRKIVVPDSAHGTNPASASMAGFGVVNIPSAKDGCVDMQALEQALDQETAGIMLTNPNTLGLFDRNILAITELVHRHGGLCYYDGANLNAIMGRVRPGDMGFDIVHLNLHKTFATPHGGGGPGSGPVGVSQRLVDYLPVSRVVKLEDGQYFLDYDYPKSIGYIAPFYGNFGVILKAYAYILRLGREGIVRASENAVLAANYLRKRLEDVLEIPHDRICMHEFVASAAKQAEKGVRALDIAKALLDKGHYAPTIYFPLIVKECLMFEPTETESKETLDGFVDDLIEILGRVETDAASIQNAPVTTPVQRLDEVRAARSMELVDDAGL